MTENTNNEPSNKKKAPTVAQVLDLWAEEELRPGDVSNGTLSAYLAVIRRIKKHPVAATRINRITPEQLQTYLNDIGYGRDGIRAIPRSLSRGYMLQVLAVLKGAFHYALTPCGLLREDPMAHVRLKLRMDGPELLNCDCPAGIAQTITHAQYRALTMILRANAPSALLPVQIAYYTGLRIGEVCALTRQDIFLEKRYILVRRSMRYNSIRHQMELGTAKRGRSRIVEFGDTLAGILQQALECEPCSNHAVHPAQCKKNVVRTIMEGGRAYHELYSLGHDTPLPADYHEMQFVCLQASGAYLRPNTIAQICTRAAAQVDGLQHFHFHMLRHTYASNLIGGGAHPADVSELLGHRDVHTTLSIYTHALQGTRRASVQILDQLSDD